MIGRKKIDKMLVDMNYREMLEDNFKPYIKIKDNRIVTEPLNDYSERKIIIPSKLFPLIGEGEIKLYSHLNTTQLDEDEIAKVFDMTEYKMGRCYSNAETLYSNLKLAGINDVETWVGWKYLAVFDVPVLHCCIVYKSKYILDLSSDNGLKDCAKKYADLAEEEARKAIAEYYINRNNLKNSERTYFGHIGRTELFIGRKCKPDEGRKLSAELRKTYPNHIIFKNVNKTTRVTPLQQQIMDLQK